MSAVHAACFSHDIFSFFFLNMSQLFIAAGSEISPARRGENLKPVRIKTHGGLNLTDQRRP
jgi:hypothetical protein